jgi:hypothetical protein
MDPVLGILLGFVGLAVCIVLAGGFAVTVQAIGPRPAVMRWLWGAYWIWCTGVAARIGYAVWCYLESGYDLLRSEREGVSWMVWGSLLGGGLLLDFGSRWGAASPAPTAAAEAEEVGEPDAPAGPSLPEEPTPEPPVDPPRTVSEALGWTVGLVVACCLLALLVRGLRWWFPELPWHWLRGRGRPRADAGLVVLGVAVMFVVGLVFAMRRPRR